MSIDHIKKCILGSEISTVEKPRPLLREMEPADPFPTDAMGFLLGNAVKGIQDKIQVPVAIAAQSVLAVSSLSIQGHADVMLPHGQKRPVSNYFLSIAASGERKTASDNEAMRPVREHEKTLQSNYKEEIQLWGNRTEVFDEHKKRITRSRQDWKEQANQLDALGSRPEKPMFPMLTCEEPTYEGMIRFFQEGNNSLGIFSSEGSQFVSGYGMSKDNRLKTVAALSSAWDGETITRIRSGDDLCVLQGKRPFIL